VSHRPADWHPLADRDPLPGDPHRVGGAARRFRNTAQQLRDQAARLRQLAQDGSIKSEAWHSFSSKAPHVAGQLEKAQMRYAEAGAALDDYSTVLMGAQAEGDAALAEGKDAEQRRLQATAALASATASYQSASASYHAASASYQAQQTVKPAAAKPGAASAPAARAPVPPDDGEVRRAQAAVQQANDDLAAARRRLAHAVEDRDTAVDRAHKSMTYTVDHDPLHNSGWHAFTSAVSHGWHAATSAVSHGWDSFKATIKDNAHWIAKVADIAGWVATVTGTLALAVGWIPIGGQAAAAILGTIALAATAVSLTGHALLAMTGNGNWADVFIDVVAVATLGAGRAFGIAAKSSFAGARASSRAEAYVAIRAAGGRSESGIYRAVNAATGGRAGAGIARPSTVARAGTKRLPSGQAWKDAFNVRDMLHLRKPELGVAEKRLSSEVQAAERVHEAFRTDDYLRLVRQGHDQLSGWAVSTATGFLTDDANHLGKFDAFKEHTVWAP
jgi:hypothetical protein